MSIVLAPGISHRPGSSSENIIQPVVDATGLILRPFSNAQSAPVFQVQNVDGTAVHFGLNPDGEIQLLGGVGTSGQVLTSAGVGNPVSWSTPSGGDLSAAAILAPASVDRNLIQPTADGDSLTLRPFSDAQTSPVLRVQNEAGTADNLTVNADGSLHLHAAADATSGLIVKSFSPTQIGLPLQVQNSDGSNFFAVEGLNANVALQLDAGAVPQQAVVITANASGGNLDNFLLCTDLDQAGSPAVFQVDFAGNLHVGSGTGPGAGTTPLPSWQFSATTNQIIGSPSDSGGGPAQAVNIKSTFADNTHGATKGRLLLQAYDTSLREGLRVEATGAAPAIGFLGAAAAVRQTGGAATAGVLYTATEQGMLQKVYDMGRTFGFLT